MDQAEQKVVFDKIPAMTTDQKIRCIRSFEYWVRVCDEGSPVKYIVVDPLGDDEGWMVAGGEDVLELTVEDLAVGNPEVVAEYQS